MEPTLSIVIPIYNEVASLKELLQQVGSVEIGMKKELILVDDFSTDGTRDILKEIEAIQADSDEIRQYISVPQMPSNENAISDSEVPKSESSAENTSDISAKVFYHDVNKGKGATLRTGFQHITGEITLIQDADLEYDPEDYPKLLQPILTGEADVVYGSRFLEGRQTGLLRSYLANQFLTTLANIVNGTRLTDMETCYKVIRTSILKEISLYSDRFGFEPEITAKLARRKCKIVEVPISYRGRDYHEGKTVSWKDGVAAIFHILRFRFFS
ncbi:glycosyltransferase family 2 protein [Candidatus Poribacteria bacterium]|nr:glycosyltransferase family 2 protein [Candidatus Poribacteria bacterium]MYA58420.1 glycosyltransferase family 2 protein [Candidatus Poribacteria bacterium]